MERLIRLKAPADIVGVEYGGKHWPVENGHVLVPDGAGLRLRDMGFKFPDDPKPVSKSIERTPERETLHLKHGRR